MKENPNDMYQGKRPPNGSNKNNRDDFQWKKGSRSIIFWVILFLSIGFFTLMFQKGGKEANEIGYQTYLTYLKNNDIAKGEVTISKDVNEFKGYLKDRLSDGRSPEYEWFTTMLPYVNEQMVNEWQERGVEIKFTPPSAEWLEVFGSFLPWILILAIWIFFFRRIQGGGAGKNIFSFGRSRAKKDVYGKRNPGNF
jgi:cell division protease FtsH